MDKKSSSTNLIFKLEISKIKWRWIGGKLPYQQLAPGRNDLKKSSGIGRVYLINYSEKPGPIDTETDDVWYKPRRGFKPRNESIDSINTPEALSYFDRLSEKYNREEIPNFWDSRLGGR